MDTVEPRERSLVRRLRTFVLLILALGMAGTAADLLLIEHYEDAWQAPPLVLIGLALCTIAAIAVRAGPVLIAALRGLMALFILSGGAGVLLHYNSNSEFQRELDPDLAGWPLAVKVLTAKAPPALAPGVMVQLGLLGLVYTYRHPALARRTPGIRQQTGAEL